MSGGDFTFGIFVVAMICIVCAGFDDDYQHPWEHEAAVMACSKNAGYSQLKFDWTGYVVMCNDGATFEYDGDITFKGVLDDK